MSTFKERLLTHRYQQPNGCWRWTGCKNQDGYGLIGGPRINGKPYARKTHRVAYAEFIGRIPKGLSVLHKCDNRACINPEHLYLGTQRDNVRDMAERNQRRWDAVRWLTDKQVRAIRASKESNGVLGARYKIVKCCISFVRTRRTYKHVI